jgi:flagellin-like protein
LATLNIDLKFTQVKYRIVRFHSHTKVRNLTKRMLRSKRAISPILATLLLVVIAVAAIVVTYAWIMTYMNNAGRQAGVRMYKINIRFYNESVQKIDVDMGNSGTEGTTVTALYIGASQTDMQNQTMTSKPLLAGGSCRITLAYNWTNGATYYFKVLSSSGQTYEGPETAPVT